MKMMNLTSVRNNTTLISISGLKFPTSMSVDIITQAAPMPIALSSSSAVLLSLERSTVTPLNATIRRIDPTPGSLSTFHRFSSLSAREPALSKSLTKRLWSLEDFQDDSSRIAASSMLETTLFVKLKFSPIWTYSPSKCPLCVSAIVPSLRLTGSPRKLSSTRVITASSLLRISSRLRLSSED